MSGQLEFGEEDRSATLRHAWELCLHLLSTRINKVSMETYIRPIQPIEYVGVSVTLGVTSAFQRERLEKNHLNPIRSALEFHLDTTGLQIRFVVMTRDQQATLEGAAGARRARSSRPVPQGQTALPLDADGESSPQDAFDPASTLAPATSQRTLGLSFEEEAKEKKQREEKQIPEEKTVVKPPVSTSNTPRAALSSKSKTQSSKSDDLPISSLPLNPRYQLANYLVGRSNRFAHANAIAVAAKPGEAYNPFFIYGGPGLGKTHLMQGIAHAIALAHPRLRVAYMTGEYFAQHYITAIREHATEDFRRQYRHIDVWIMDDIQYIAGKEHTKEEFFHTFNTLYQSGRQIILASDRSPRDLNTMDERLRSRFQSGLIADITPPDLETRLAFLHNLCEREAAPVPENVLEFIASVIQSNMRTLEGAITKLMAYSSVMNAVIDTTLAHGVLGEFFVEKRNFVPGEVDAETIARAVAEEFDVRVSDLKGTGRNKDVALARQVAMYLCREFAPTMNLRHLGAIFGGRDHSTVLRAYQKVKDVMEVDTELQQSVERLTKKIAGRS